MTRRHTMVAGALVALGVVSTALSVDAQSIPWDPDRFGGLVEAGEEGARIWAETDSDEARLDALAAFDEATDLLDAALDEGAVPTEAVASVEVERLRLALNGVYLEAKGGACEQAELRLASARERAGDLLHADSGSYEAQELISERRTDIAACWRQAVSNEGEAVNVESAESTETSAPSAADSTELTAEPVVSEADNREPLAWAFVGLAGACTLAAIGVDLWNAGNRSDWEALQDDCAAGSCDAAAFDELDARIDRGRAAIWGLAGASVAAGLTALALFIVDSDDDVNLVDRRLGLAPVIGVGGAGLTANVRW